MFNLATVYTTVYLLISNNFAVLILLQMRLLDDLRHWEAEQSVLEEALDTVSAAKDYFERKLETVLEKKTTRQRRQQQQQQQTEQQLQEEEEEDEEEVI